MGREYHASNEQRWSPGSLIDITLNSDFQMSYQEQSDKLAGPIALLKQYAISASVVPVLH